MLNLILSVLLLMTATFLIGFFFGLGQCTARKLCHENPIEVNIDTRLEVENDEV